LAPYKRVYRALIGESYFARRADLTENQIEARLILVNILAKMLVERLAGKHKGEGVYVDSIGK
jgi:hypothetical protein